MNLRLGRLINYFFGYLFWRSHLQQKELLITTSVIDGHVSIERDDLLADEVICCTEEANSSCPETDNFPGKFSLCVLPVRGKS